MDLPSYFLREASASLSFLFKLKLIHKIGAITNFCNNSFILS